MGPECHVIGVFIRGKETQRQTRDGKTMQAHRANAVEAEVCRDASTRQGKPRSATTTTTSRKRPEASPLWGLPREDVARPAPRLCTAGLQNRISIVVSTQFVVLHGGGPRGLTQRP